MFERQFLKDFSAWGTIMLRWLNHAGCEGEFSDLDRVVEEVYEQNVFFTPYMQKYAVRAIAEKFLVYKELEKWGVKYLDREALYNINAERMAETSVIDRGAVRAEVADGMEEPAGAVGIIAAGNIPLVVFHDFICAAACGKRVYLKLSSKDNLLFPALLNKLFEINTVWREKIRIVERILPEKVGVLLFMGSDSTAQKIVDEFRNKPVLLRKSRFSFAVISGEESDEQLSGLCSDIFLYYGLGCRNVSTLLIPENYNLSSLTKVLLGAESFVADERYRNIYKRNRAMAIMEGEKFFDGGFFLYCQREPLNLPPGMINVVRYASKADINAFVEEYRCRIQKKYCIFGEAQRPGISEYPDNADTVDFILTH